MEWKYNGNQEMCRHHKEYKVNITRKGSITEIYSKNTRDKKNE